MMNKSDDSKKSKLFVKPHLKIWILCKNHNWSHKTHMTVYIYFILEWTTSLDTSCRTLFVREGGTEYVCRESGWSRRVT